MHTPVYTHRQTDTDADRHTHTGRAGEKEKHIHRLHHSSTSWPFLFLLQTQQLNTWCCSPLYILSPFSGVLPRFSVVAEFQLSDCKVLVGYSRLLFRSAYFWFIEFFFFFPKGDAVKGVISSKGEFFYHPIFSFYIFHSTNFSFTYLILSYRCEIFSISFSFFKNSNLKIAQFLLPCPHLLLTLHSFNSNLLLSTSRFLSQLHISTP